jgi:hypothetical protein
MNELEERFIDQWCALFGKSIRGHLDSDNARPHRTACRNAFGTWPTLRPRQVHRAFVHEVLSRIAEIAPEASRRVEARILARKPLAATSVFRGGRKGGSTWEISILGHASSTAGARFSANCLQAQLNGRRLRRNHEATAADIRTYRRSPALT